MLKINSLACKCPGDSVSFLPVLIFWLGGGSESLLSQLAVPVWVGCQWIAGQCPPQSEIKGRWRGAS